MEESGGQWLMVLSLGLFAVVVVVFTLIQLLRKPTVYEPVVEEEDVLAYLAKQGMDVHAVVVFRDEVMVRLDALLDEQSLEERPTLHAVEPIAFELRSAGEEREPMLVVLTRVLQGCLAYPEQEEMFKEHFVRDVVRTWCDAQPNRDEGV